MKRRAMLLSPLALLGVQKHNYRFDRRYPVTSGVMDIDIVNGEVRVKAGGGKEIRVQAEIELTAPIVEDLELAKGEVRFEPRLEGQTFRVWVENPEQRQRQRYSCRHNVEVEMPAGMRLILRGVNGGVRVSYSTLPERDIYIKNVNGEIEVEFPKELQADFQLKTMNGSIYTGFAMTEIPGKTETEVTEHGMRRIVSRNRYSGGRVGRGGIEVRVEGLNGDIRILERKV